MPLMIRFSISNVWQGEKLGMQKGRRVCKQPMFGIHSWR